MLIPHNIAISPLAQDIDLRSLSPDSYPKKISSFDNSLDHSRLLVLEIESEKKINQKKRDKRSKTISRAEDRTPNLLGKHSDCEREIITIRPRDSSTKFY